jgi:hypothetical protein
VIRHVLPECLHVENRDPEQLRSILWPFDATEPDKGHDIATVRALSVSRFTPFDPGFEDGGDGVVEVLDAGFDLGSECADDHRRQCRQLFLAGDKHYIRQSNLPFCPGNVSDNRIYQN